MPRPNKRKLTTSERRAKSQRKAEFMTVFINGKPKRVRRPPTIEGLPEDEFIRRNADPLWLHQNEMWDLIPLDPDCAPGPPDDDSPPF